MEPLSRKRRAPELQSEHSLRIFRNNLHGQSAWDRHQKYVTRYLQVYKRDGEKEARQEQVDSTARNDWDVLKEKHRFLRDEEEEINEANGFEYDIEVARRYYKHLFKEYAIADMKHYKSGNLALRWRSEDDVVDGIGQFTCANTRCEHHRHLQSSSRKLDPYEVNFAYQEPSASDKNSIVSKNALVKIVLCHRCSRKLKYKSDKEKARRSVSPTVKKKSK